MKFSFDTENARNIYLDIEYAECKDISLAIQNFSYGISSFFAEFMTRLKCDTEEKAEKVQSLIGLLGYTESGIPYPLSAKYHMTLCGIETNLITRNPACRPLTEYNMDSVRQMKLLTDEAEKLLGLN